MNVSDTQVSEKIGMQFDMMINDNQHNHTLLVEVVHTFKRITPHVSNVFREKNILAK